MDQSVTFRKRVYIYEQASNFDLLYQFELNSLRNNEITMKLLIMTFLAVTTKRKSEMPSYLPNFMTAGSQMLELDRRGGLFCPPPNIK